MPSANITVQSLVEEPTASATHILESLIEEAQRVRASDMHLEPIEECVRVRIRVDGELITYEPLPRWLHAELIARIKILAGLRTDEHQRPQDGRFRHRLAAGSELDVRVAITPTYFGENAVLRLLFPFGEALTLEGLGFLEAHRRIVREALAKPHGLILATGPTGSGKTSTLYTFLHLLATPARSIITIEDPIEYAIPAITQIQANERAGLTFETGLRSILRQDPDMIMVGEIRDKETGRLAVNAALTGHTVLSSLHTNDAPTALPRLLDLSVEPYLLPSTVRLIIAQRLVRRVCSGCRTKRAFDTSEQALLLAWSQVEPMEIPAAQFVGTGCRACNKTGYRGRVGLFELLPMDGVMRDIVLTHPSATHLRTLALSQGMRSLAADGIMKVGLGITTLEEVARISYE